MIISLSNTSSSQSQKKTFFFSFVPFIRVEQPINCKQVFPLAVPSLLHSLILMIQECVSMPMAKEKEKEEDVIFDGRSNLSSKASFIKANGKRKEPWDFDWGTLLLINQWRKTSHSLTLLKSRKMKRIFSFFLSLMNYSNAEKQKRERNKSFLLSQLVFKFSLFFASLWHLYQLERLLEVSKQKKIRTTLLPMLSHSVFFFFLFSFFFFLFEHCLFVFNCRQGKTHTLGPRFPLYPPFPAILPLIHLCTWQAQTDRTHLGANCCLLLNLQQCFSLT